MAGKNCSKSDYSVPLLLTSQFSAPDLARNVLKKKKKKVLELCQVSNSRHFKDIAKKFLHEIELYMGTTVAKQRIFICKIKTELCLGMARKLSSGISSIFKRLR